MPEGALGSTTVRWKYALSAGGSALEGGNERLQDLLVPRVVVAVDVGGDSRPLNGLGPRVAHVVGLAGVIPRLDLNHVRLQLEGLGEAVLEVALAATVPVLAWVGVLELQRGDAHHEELAGALGGFLKGLVGGGGHVYLAFVDGGPRVPVEDAILSHIS